MKTNAKSWKWLLGLGLATLVSVGAIAQHGDDGRHRRHRDSHDGKHRHENSDKRNLSDRVYHITQADSVQKTKMKPAVDHASKRLEALRTSYSKQEKIVLDSLRLQVKPYLKEEQIKKLDDWKNR